LPRRKYLDPIHPDEILLEDFLKMTEELHAVKRYFIDIELNKYN
jgi:hypothetical protein